MDNFKLIGLAGKARVGKDTVGNYLSNNYAFNTYAFAGPLKRAVCEMFGIPMEIFDDSILKETVIPFWGYSPRQMAQLLGTEGGRELFDKDIWVKRAQYELDSIKPIGLGMAVTDVRFENEADWIRENGGAVWHITREGVASVSAHASENGVEVKAGDHVFPNNGTFEELYMKIDSYFQSLSQVFDSVEGSTVDIGN